jgi:hypothetical protein
MKLPNFLIIGANKAGTTSLSFYCSQHPDIYISPVKEPMFFSSVRERKVSIEGATLDDPYACFTLDEYLHLFAQAKERLIGESSTSYLANPYCAVLIKKIIPDVKLIAVLRNPIERALSVYKMYYGSGIEKRGFEEAVADELKNREALPYGKNYLKVGLYASQLKAFLRYFPRDRVFIGSYDEYNRDTVGFLQRIFRFLGAREFSPPDLSRLNTSREYFSGPAAIPSMSQDQRKKLATYFEDDISELRNIVDFDVSNWLSDV